MKALSNSRKMIPTELRTQWKKNEINWLMVSKLCSKQLPNVELKTPDQTCPVNLPNQTYPVTTPELSGKHITAHSSCAKNRSFPPQL
jgi:hypothetical protein